MAELNLVDRVLPAPFALGVGLDLGSPLSSFGGTDAPHRQTCLATRIDDEAARPAPAVPAATRAEADLERAVAALTASPEELSLRLGSKILTLGYRSRGRHRVVVRPLADCAAVLLTSSNGGTYRLKPSRIEGAEPYRCLPAVEITPPAARIARFAGASVTAGVVTTAEGRTIAETLEGTARIARFGPFSRDARGTLVQNKPRFAVNRRLRGGPTVLLKQPLHDRYGRWLVESLPRLALVEDHFDLRQLSFIVSAGQGCMRAHYEDALALFGIGPEQIVEAGDDETLIVDDLIYPAPLAAASTIFAPRCIEVLEQVATRVRADPTGAQRLYVLRSDPARRPIENEAAIVAIVERHGFSVVEPETLSLFQQIGLFRQSRIVVGAPGAALCNAMFSTKDLTLFALGPDVSDDAMFANLMSIKDGRYMALHGTANAEGAVAIDPAFFEAMLTSIVDPR